MRLRILSLGLAAGWATAAVPPPVEPAIASPGLEQTVRPFFARHCTDCHGAEKQKGDLRVDMLALDYRSPQSMAHWEEIMSRINSGEMPPDDRERPEPAEVVRISEWIAGQLCEAEVVRQSSGDRVTFHKLSRDEYANTIRDLLGVNFDAKGPTGLPEDGDWHGFERIGAAMSISPFYVEKYLAAADAILDEALSLRPEPKPELTRLGAYDMRWGNFRAEYESRGIGDKVRLEIVPNNLSKQDSWNLEVKTTGDYRVRVKPQRSAAGRWPRAEAEAVYPRRRPDAHRAAFSTFSR